MSDIEEPAAKISKLDQSEQDGEEMEEGQEEWLSEGILTDEDCNPSADHDQSNSTVNTSQDEANNESTEQELEKPVGLHLTVQEGIIEETLNTFENLRTKTRVDSGSAPKQTENSTAVKTEDNDTESDLDASAKQSDDDGNDTDDLLRMLGDDNSKKEKILSKTKQVNDKQHSTDEDDDDYIFEGAKVTRMKLAKDVVINTEGARVTRMKIAKDVVMNTEAQVKRLKVAKGALIQKMVPTKAVPEDMSDTEVDSEVNKRLGPRLVSKQVERMKVSKGAVVQKGGSKTGSEDDKGQVSTKITKFKSVSALARRLVNKNVSEDNSDADEDSVPSSDEATTMKRIFGVRPAGAKASPRQLRPRNGINAVQTVTKRVVSIETKKPPTPQPKQAQPKQMQPNQPQPKQVQPKLPQPKYVQPKQPQPKELQPKQPQPAPGKAVMVLTRPAKREAQEVDHEERLDDDSADMDTDLEEDEQRLMQPEQMDEEVPSDAESHSDADSYYDELPSTDSEVDAEEWFTLDLRVERAADYIPLLGANAHTLLVAEQQRAAARLTSLRQSAKALCAGRRALASQLRFARQTLAQLDAALTAQ